MRRIDLTDLQSKIRANEAEVNQAVRAFVEQLRTDEQWHRLRQKERSADERLALDEACVSRYEQLKTLGLVAYNPEKRVMSIAGLDIL